MSPIWFTATKTAGALATAALVVASWVDGLPSGTATTLIGVVAGVLAIWQQRNQVAITGLNVLVERQQAEIARGDRDRAALHQENRVLRVQVGRALGLELGVRRLVDQLERNDIEPVWRPPAPSPNPLGGTQP